MPSCHASTSIDSRNRHVCLEEGTLSEWLCEVMERHEEELVVTGVHRSRGPNSDQRDKVALAEQLPIASLETRVYKGAASSGGWAMWRGGTRFVLDVARVKNRLKSVLRPRDVS